jgi:hypothetical protein
MNDLLLGAAMFVLGVNLGAVVLGLLVAHRHREARVPRDGHTERSGAVRSVRSELVEEAGYDSENDSGADEDDEPDKTPAEAAEDSLLDGGERVGTKRTNRGRDASSGADSPDDGGSA